MMEYASLEKREGEGEGGGAGAEHFYQEPNPPNAALNKNETDEDWKIGRAIGSVILDKQEIF